MIKSIFYRNQTIRPTLQAMQHTLKLVDTGTRAYKAAALSGIPEQTMRDGILGYIPRGVIRSGTKPLLCSFAPQTNTNYLQSNLLQNR